jgi:hypothetical protein
MREKNITIEGPSNIVASFGVFEPTGFCPTNVFFIANFAMNFDITGVVFSGFIGEHMDA